MMRIPILLLSVALSTPNLALLVLPTAYRIPRTLQSSHQTILSAVRRYGPPDETQSSQSSSPDSTIVMNRLNDLITQVVAAQQRHVPGLLSQNLSLILQALQQPELLEKVAETQERQAVVEYMTDFAQAFVEELKAVDDSYKRLLGRIMRTMQKSEGELDDLMGEIRSELSPGFLRHLEGECRRIESAPTMTPESLRLLQILRTIQVRIVEELGQAELGDGAVVLGQLLGYDDDEERRTVLQAGLNSRGTEFAIELRSLTQEALENLPSEADPDLIARVRQVDEMIAQHLSKK